MAVFYQQTSGKLLQVNRVETVFPFLSEPGHVISVVGAGGKTSLLYEMARFSASRGLKTLVTTTTHIMRPDPAIHAYCREQVVTLWENGSFAVVGTLGLDEKLSMPPQDELRCYMDLADIVLVEADGAKRMPLKVPGDREPVILPECDIIIGVMGLDALNQPLKQVCFRLEQAKEFLGAKEDDFVTVEHAIQILSSDAGTRKKTEDRTYMVVLNKCDNETQKRQGERILEALSSMNIRGVLSCLKGDI